jgi:hypothetical protein
MTSGLNFGILDKKRTIVFYNFEIKSQAKILIWWMNIFNCRLRNELLKEFYEVIEPALKVNDPVLIKISFYKLEKGRPLSKKRRHFYEILDGANNFNLVISPVFSNRPGAGKFEFGAG